VCVCDRERENVSLKQDCEILYLLLGCNYFFSNDDIIEVALSQSVEQIRKPTVLILGSLYPFRITADIRHVLRFVLRKYN
jgi:hypothetical protein